jgi:signal transduction histidine kinase
MDAPGKTPVGSAGVARADSSQLLDPCLATGVVAIDDHQRIIALSPGAGKLLGLDPSEALAQSVNVLPDALRDALQAALSGGDLVVSRPLQLPAAPSQAPTVRVSTTPIHAPDKRAGAIAVLNDVSAAGQLDHNLRKLDRLASIGMLSASMAHEIKNALVAVKTFVDLLIKKNQDASLADIVGREMRRIDSIVSQMLRFAGPARPTLGVIHLHPVIEHSLNLVQHHLEGRRINLLRSLDAAPDTLRADAYQLEQAFINLFFNALDAMGARGELSVKTEFVPSGGPENPRAPVLRVTVRDTGVGIPPENLERLFEPFFTTKPNGTGLGLPITRRIVQEHSGMIHVASEPNCGTVFTLLLPVVESAAGRQP